MKIISFVIPCYYSEKTIEKVVEDIIAEFPEENYIKEIILVDDGSTDNTSNTIKKLSDKYPYITAVVLDKNYGQDCATIAGYTICTGEYIVTLDDDGQNKAAEVHKLLTELIKGYDVVFSKYHDIQHSMFRNIGSFFNDYSMNLFQGKPKHITINSFFVMTKEVKEKVISYKGPSPIIYALLTNATNNMSNVYVEHKERLEGSSNYTLSKLIKLWYKEITFKSSRASNGKPQYSILEIYKGNINK